MRKSGVRFFMADSNVLNTKWLKKATKARLGDRWTVVVSSSSSGPAFYAFETSGRS